MSKALEVGEPVQCRQCGAPFSVTARDIGFGGNGHASAILVPSSLAEGEAATPPPQIPPPQMGILEGRPKQVAMVAGPFLPPPVPKAVPVATPFEPPPATRRSGALAAVIGGLFLLAGGVIGLATYALSSPADDQEKAAQAPVVLQLPEQPAKSLPNPKAADPAKEAAKATPAKALPEGNNKELPAVKPEVKPPPEPDPKPGPMPDPKPARVPVPVPKAEARAGELPKAEQDKVNAAIDRGVRYLKSCQYPNGSWPGNRAHLVGCAALPGLTLLECGVPASDAAVKRAAAFVRTYSPTIKDTYDLALAVLFLDRVGNPKDRKLIQQLSLRLVAGQNSNGGWDYRCPYLTSPQANELLVFLHQTRPEAALLLDPLVVNPKNLDPPKKGKPADLNNPLDPKGAKPLPDPLSKDPQNKLPNPITGPDKKSDDKTKLIPPGPKEDPKGKKPDSPANPKEAKPKAPGREGPAVKPRIIPVQQLSAVVKQFAIVRYLSKGKLPLSNAGRDDNSNSQFALLALWAARRHNVPTERSLALAKLRYHVSQNADGGWGYQHQTGTTPAMTGVGLLGLAIGHGASDDGLKAALDAMKNRNAPPRPVLNDPAIAKGLEAFSRFIGQPDPNQTKPLMENLYFLWTVERVAVLYNLRTIGGKDWYGWGVQMLLAHEWNGRWLSQPYPGNNPTIDTCFALLFLRRSNLIQDLTENLHFYLAITDPKAGSSQKR
jgi:hypothetical protein